MCVYTCYGCSLVAYSMPDDDLTPEEQALVSRADVAQSETKGMKRGLAKEKNVAAARRKGELSRHMQPPQELTEFLQSGDTFNRVLAEAEKDAGHPCLKVYMSSHYI